jgi:hypothetical protein
VSNSTPPSLIAQLKVLDPNQIKRIDAALTAVGDFGEVRLIKAKGRLRYIQTLDSEKVEEKLGTAE